MEVRYISSAYEFEVEKEGKTYSISMNLETKNNENSIKDIKVVDEGGQVPYTSRTINAETFEEHDVDLMEELVTEINKWKEANVGKY